MEISLEAPELFKNISLPLLQKLAKKTQEMQNLVILPDMKYSRSLKLLSDE